MRDMTSKIKAAGSNAAGKWTKIGWLATPNGLPCTASLSVQRPATRRLSLQRLRMLIVHEPARPRSRPRWRPGLGGTLLLDAGVALEALVYVFEELLHIHFGGLGGVLELLQGDVLRVAVVGIRLIASAGYTHVGTSLDCESIALLAFGCLRRLGGNAAPILDIPTANVNRG